VRRVCRRSWRPVRRSLRWVRRPCRRCIPCVPVASAGAAGVPAASCASASNGSSADDKVKPNAAPSPSREIAFRREIISALIISFTCCLLSLTIAELEWRQWNAITSMFGRRVIGTLPSPQCREALAFSRPLASSWFHFSTWRVPRMAELLPKATKGAATCNLVELRGQALKNYGVTEARKGRHCYRDDQIRPPQFHV
jgi:hypothetical protein